MATLIDTHCHLDYEYDGKTPEQLVAEARAAGVETLITIGVDASSIPRLQKISGRFENVFHTVGVHPHEAGSMSDEQIAQLREAARHPKCRAIGEIGLDYHYTHSPREAQLARLQQLLDLALEVRLPIVVHSREGEEDLLPMLEAYAARVHADGTARSPGIIHCFTGTQPFAEACVRLGFYISFSGILTFKNAEDLRASARALPIDRILVETDSPYLAPVPMRGKKCEPAYVVHTARKLAELKGVSFEQLAEATTANARRALGI